MPKQSGSYTEQSGIYTWMHRNEGFIAAGVCASWAHEPRISGAPSSRFSDAQQWWESLVAHTSFVNDDGDSDAGKHNQARDGLMAFGSFTFSPASAVPSSMRVPEVVVYLRSCPQTDALSENVQGNGTRYYGWISVVRDMNNPQPLSRCAQNLHDNVHRHKKGLSMPPSFSVKKHDSDMPGCSLKADIKFSTSIEHYQSAFRYITDAIMRGEVQKVVLARRADIRADAPLDEKAMIAHLRCGFPECWVFSYDHFIGATPEMLVAMHDSMCESLVLAGTQRCSEAKNCSINHHRDAHAGDSVLLHSEKDRIEHQYAVDSVVSVMNNYGTVDSDPTPHVLHLRNVNHLATRVRTKLSDDVHIFSVLDALHPTAAVGGTSKAAAATIIHEAEMMDRERFAGPIGWINASGNSQWALALRCIQLTTPYSGKTWAGGGIVAGSRMNEELNEIDAKILPIRQALRARE